MSVNTRRCMKRFISVDEKQGCSSSPDTKGHRGKNTTALASSGELWELVCLSKSSRLKHMSLPYGQDSPFAQLNLGQTVVSDRTAWGTPQKPDTYNAIPAYLAVQEITTNQRNLGTAQANHLILFTRVMQDKIFTQANDTHDLKSFYNVCFSPWHHDGLEMHSGVALQQENTQNVCYFSDKLLNNSF